MRPDDPPYIAAAWRWAVLTVGGGLGAALPAHAGTASDHGVGPWSEAVISVRDLAESSTWLIEDGGWRVMGEGALAPEEIAYWKLPGTVTGAFRLVCAAEAETGCIRFLRFDGAAEQRPIRLAARPWDTGGIFSVMLRSEDTAALFDAAIARGWWAESEPYRFSFGGSQLVNVVIQGPHGVNYALYQREVPPFAEFPVGRLSQAFNTMRMVKDQPASLAWYRDILGFETLFDAPFTDPQPRPNNFSVPPDLATTLVRRAGVAQPVMPAETGRVEVMQFVGFAGRDFAAYAAAPNLGIISVRFPVRAFDEYLADLAAKGLKPTLRAKAVAVSGLGTLELAAFRDPDGNLTEFYAAP